MLLLIISVSVAAVLALISWALILFTRHSLKNDLRKTSLTIVVLLILQFVLGMMSNLFQTVPKQKSWEVFHEFGPILLHTANATFILIFGFIFLSLALHRNKYPVAARLGLASIVLAYASGVTFVNAGQSDIYSFTMALGFISAFTTYTYIAFSSRK
jgi:heme A synthase